MRLSELLACTVFDANGEYAGHVHDVRLVQDGPVNTGFDAAIRVEGLVIGRGGVASRLGYGRSGNRGPWLIRALVTARHRGTFVPWACVRSIDERRIEISGSKDDLEPIRALPDIRTGGSA